MFKNIIGHLKTVLIHKYWVFIYACKLGIPWQGITHDLSKFSLIEFVEGCKFYSGVESPITRCKRIKGFSYAWQHHKGRNPHHFEYWIDSNGQPIDMPFKYKLEMLADYLAAGRTYMKDKFSYEIELKWYLNKITVEDPNIHPKTSDFILKALALLCDGAKNNKMKEAYKIIKHWYD